MKPKNEATLVNSIWNSQ